MNSSSERAGPRNPCRTLLRAALLGSVLLGCPPPPAPAEPATQAAPLNTAKADLKAVAAAAVRDRLIAQAPGPENMALAQAIAELFDAALEAATLDDAQLEAHVRELKRLAGAVADRVLARLQPATRELLLTTQDVDAFACATCRAKFAVNRPGVEQFQAMLAADRCELAHREQERDTESNQARRVVCEDRVRLQQRVVQAHQAALRDLQPRLAETAAALRRALEQMANGQLWDDAFGPAPEKGDALPETEPPRNAQWRQLVEKALGD
ncbi:MAG: hypothetical protein JXR37_04615 [Kiritimatiellae bacterium]|nr:hypothetical protein [Kiritimatiellia bacterium]